MKQNKTTQIKTHTNNNTTQCEQTQVQRPTPSVHPDKYININKHRGELLSYVQTCVVAWFCISALIRFSRGYVFFEYVICCYRNFQFFKISKLCAPVCNFLILEYLEHDKFSPQPVGASRAHWNPEKNAHKPQVAFSRPTNWSTITSISRVFVVPKLLYFAPWFGSFVLFVDRLFYSATWFHRYFYNAT